MPQQDDILRHAMVEGQLRPNRITCPRVLKAFESVSRQPFCRDPRISTSVYRDASIPLMLGRTWLPPLIMAHMLQWADVKANESVCVMASSLGYMGALLHTYIPYVHVQDDPCHLHNNKGETMLRGIKMHAASPSLGLTEEVDVVIIDGGVVEAWPEAEWPCKRTIGLYRNRIACRETGATAPLDVWLSPTMDTFLPEFRAKLVKDWLQDQD